MKVLDLVLSTKQLLFISHIFVAYSDYVNSKFLKDKFAFFIHFKYDKNKNIYIEKRKKKIEKKIYNRIINLNLLLNLLLNNIFNKMFQYLYLYN